MTGADIFAIVLITLVVSNLFDLGTFAALEKDAGPAWLSFAIQLLAMVFVVAPILSRVK